MKPNVLLAIFLAVTGCAFLLARPAAAQSPHTHQHSFSGAEQWAHVFDDPQRDDWQKPHEVIQALALKPDAVIADAPPLLQAGLQEISSARSLWARLVYAVDDGIPVMLVDEAKPL